jgi:hypothetical protein
MCCRTGLLSLGLYIVFCVSGIAALEDASFLQGLEAVRQDKYDEAAPAFMRAIDER